MPVDRLRLVMWNSQGAKWNSFWVNCLKEAVGFGYDVIGGLVEAGWAPWVPSQPVELGAVYPTENPQTTPYNDKVKDAQIFYDNVVGEARRAAYWIPWVKTPAELAAGARTNSRCSMSSSWLPGEKSTRVLQKPVSSDFAWMLRPAVRMDLTRAKHTLLTVFVVHLVSGGGAKARLELLDLIKAVGPLTQSGTPAIIVGDINLNLFELEDINDPHLLPPRWRLVYAKNAAGNPVATQRKGGALDYAILFDPHGQIGASAQVVFHYSEERQPGHSDHSAILYDLTSEGF